MWENLKNIQLDFSNLTVLVIGFLIGYVTGVITAKLLKMVIIFIVFLAVGLFVYFKYFV
ncbi:MAG: hypothetical protein UR93_C0002G0043 [Berkelbacteria bacterium GW2011_GWA2_35_9]|uniref:Uncharacterized protein n=1 Tax=Berkelbacteria bacterium GW2011_GWA2_35_9 TaxID=1618333 RepID=A0A0G0DK12_9BACT|nr:MAG: hypothetical protein UR93_C0002G0043 [Berkelbacteria bacterium GW2011_GWA2_35_9]